MFLYITGYLHVSISVLSDIDMAALQSSATVFFESTADKIKEWKENKV